VRFSALRPGQWTAALTVSAASAAAVASAAAIALAGAVPAAAATTAETAAVVAAVHQPRPAAHADRRTGTDWVHAVVLVNCQHHAVLLPRTFILSCADANDYLTSLRWVSWRAVAYGSGVERVNTCIPNCAAGHVRSYHALITLWRARPRGHGTGQLRFTRLTATYTGARPLRYTAHGKPYHPLSYTWRL
jgi:hypothetical protein